MSGGRLGVIGAAAVVGLVLIVVLTGGQSSEEPYALDNHGPAGLAILAETLEASDVEVDSGPAVPTSETTRALVVRDVLPGDTRDALLGWVEAGGILVVADPGSPLHGLAPSGSPFGSGIETATGCDLGALDTVSDLDDGRWWGLVTADDEDADPAAGEIVSRCIPLNDGSHAVVVLAHGDGGLVALGSLEPFTNARITEGDHVVLAAALLGAAPGDRLQVVEPPPPGGGEATLGDLIADRVALAGWLAAAGVLLLALATGRRLGRPVPERLPAVLPSAELARSVGSLLQRARARQGAAERLRTDARRAVARSLAVPTGTPPNELAALAVRHLGVPNDVAEDALVDADVDSDDRLLAVTGAVGRVRRATARPEPTDPRDLPVDPSKEPSS